MTFHNSANGTQKQVVEVWITYSGVIGLTAVAGVGARGATSFEI